MWYPKTNLHRVGKKADWELVAPEKRTFWQKVAFSTRGIVTPANVTSILGAILVGLGLWYVHTGDIMQGALCVAAGRLADILDGMIAQATGTKSSVGETVDAGLDKLIVATTLVVLFMTGIIPVWVGLLIGIRNLIATCLGLFAKAHGRSFHASRVGKFATTFEWAAILLFVSSAACAQKGWLYAETTSTIAGYVILGVAMLLGSVAIRNYAQTAQGKTHA